MQSEEAVEIDHLLTRNIDAGPHRVIRALGVRHNDVQAIGGAALEDNHQPLVRWSRFEPRPRPPE